MIKVLEGIIGAVVRAPADEAKQVAAVVEIFVEEFFGRGNVVGEKLALELRPSRRRHRRVHGDGGRRTSGGATGQASWVQLCVDLVDGTRAAIRPDQRGKESAADVH